MTRALGHERNDTIDSFRAVAILSVLAYHFNVLAPKVGVSLLSPHALDLGRFGVHLFFIISGIVITMTLERSATVGMFAVKRIARLYPAYLVGMLLTATAFLLQGTASEQFFSRVIENLSPYDFGQTPMDPSYWSLTCEIHFYVVAGVAFVCLGRRFWIGLIGFMLTGALVAFRHPYSADLYLDARFMPLFVLGVGAFLLFAGEKRDGVIVIGFALFGYAFGANRFDAFHGSYVTAARDAYILGLGGLMILFIRTGINLSVPPLPWIGRISYSLYLIHQAVGIILMSMFKGLGFSSTAAMMLAVAFIILLAWLMFNYVERPGRRLVMRFFDMSRRFPSRGSMAS